MTDADAMSELVRAGLRNPARIVVKVQAKRPSAVDDIPLEAGDVIHERRIPPGYVRYTTLVEVRLPYSGVVG